MNPSTVLQWIGLAVVGILGLAVAIALFRLLWIAVSRQWTKYNRLDNRLRAAELTLFGGDSIDWGGTVKIFTDLDIRYKVGEHGMYRQFEAAMRRIKRADEELVEIKERLAELESYRPANIENPEDLR